MTVDYTVDTLITRVRRASQLATLNTKLSASELLAIADEEVQSVLWPILRASSGDYGVEFMTVTVPYYASASDPLSLSGVARLPMYCSASTISKVYYVRSDDTLTELPRMSFDQLHEYGTTTVTDPLGYVIRGDSLQLVPNIGADATVRIYFEARPNKLVLTTSATAITLHATQPDAFENPTGVALTNGYRYDVVSWGPPLGAVARFLRLLIDPPPALINYFLYQTTSGDLATSGFGLRYSDPYLRNSAGIAAYLCVPGETCIFPLPDAWWPAAISQIAARACLETGDADGAASLGADAQRRLDLLVQHQANRARKQGVATFDRDGTIRGGSRPRWSNDG